MKQSSYLNTYNSHSQAQKDKLAYENTKKVIHQRQQMKRQYQRWVPQSIKSQNAIFSKQLVKHKPLRKQSNASKITVSIFNMSSDFRPCVKRTEISKRDSHLFSQNQSQANWRSSSKHVEPLNQSKQYTPKKVLKSSINHKAKNSTIDLSWGVTSVQEYETQGDPRRTQGEKVQREQYINKNNNRWRYQYYNTSSIKF